jgi:hypothetical protein
MTANAVRLATTSDSLLRFAIRLDGVVVAGVGTAMVACAGTLSRLTGLPIAAEYGIGVLSIAYGPLAFWLAARPKLRGIGLTIARINVGATPVLVALVVGGLVPTATGSAMALAVGAYTAVIGVVQYLGVRRMRH